jgi:DNA-binding transcriptional MocR family regulator
MITQRLTARRLQELLGAWRGDGHSYRELSESIGILVRDGRLPPASVLPAERPLAEQLGVSRTTVASAYEDLRERGVVESRRGSGTVVRTRRGDRAPWEPGAIGEIALTRASPGPWTRLPELGRQALDEHPDAFLLDGFDTIGHPALRAAIAERYTRRGLPTDPDQIMVTLGAQHAIFLIARTLLRRGDRALVESPSYPHAREALAAAGGLVAEIPVGPHGYDAGSIVEIARRTAARLAYLIPDHHNPTGLSMPPELRERLIEELAGHGTHLVVDETTAELVLGAPRPVLPFAWGGSAPPPTSSDASRPPAWSAISAPAPGRRCWALWPSSATTRCSPTAPARSPPGTGPSSAHCAGTCRSGASHRPPAASASGPTWGRRGARG